MLTKPGIYPDIPIDVYHSSPGISSSGISKILECPKRYWYEYLSGKKKDWPEKSQRIGSATHGLFLEPEKFNNQFAFVKSLLSNAGKEDREKYALEGKITVTEEEVEIAICCVNSIKSHPVMQKLKDGKVEQSLVWDEENVLLRSRPDFYNDFLIVDIKTTENASPSAFERSIYINGYHRQGAIACDGLTKLTGNPYQSVLLIAVEKTPPYLVGCYLLSQDALQVGRAEYKRGIRIYQECVEKNQWPGYSELILEIGIPQWALIKAQEYL